MKKLVILLTLIVSMLNVNKLYASESVQQTNDWQLHSTIDGVKFYVKIDTCSQYRTKFIVKAENQNNYAVTIQYSLEVPKYDSRGVMQGTIENIQPGAVFLGDCSIFSISYPYLIENKSILDLLINAQIIQTN